MQTIKMLAARLNGLRGAADAFDDLKSKALNFIRATRTPLERFNEQVKLLHKLATTIDPKTGKALIDTDTLNRGLQKARDLLRSLKDDVSNFISGKREFVQTIGTRIVSGSAQAAAAVAAGARRNRRGLFRQFGPTPPGGIFQGAPPNLFGGQPGTIHPRPITASVDGIGGTTSEQILGRIESLIRLGIPRADKTRAN